MQKESNLPIGNQETVVHSTVELGALINSIRKQQKLTQKDVAGLGNTGNRLVVDIENGKPTVQLQKVFDLLNLLGLEISIKRKGM